MSLRSYRQARNLVLSPNDPVLDAARAIEQNRVGAVVVQDRGRVVGILTDRDLAVRALGRALDPHTTKIREVMTPSPVTLTPADSQDAAIELMQRYNVRRIPLVENDRCVGMVSLDDLILDEAAPLEELAAIVESQIGEGGLPESPRTPGRRRRLARAEATLGRFVQRVRAACGLDTTEQACKALDVVLRAVVRRLTPMEAKDFIAQLPSLLQRELQKLPPGPDKSISRASLESELAGALDVEPERAARLLVDVARVVQASISPGQAEDVCRQMPEDLRAVFAVPSPTEEGATA